MGLDMYLSAEKYIWSDENGDIQQAINDAGIDTKGMRVKGITVDAMYWRKANAIHSWFVNVIQDGEDDCRPYNVEVEQLKELVDLCKDVLAHRDNPEYAKEHLSPMAGFFFGDTDIDEFYYEDLQDTIDGLEKFINDDEFVRSWDFTYRSSW
jgi:hypothetical protein